MIEIMPVNDLDAEITVPGSKYIANRVLLIAALSEGMCTIKNLPNNDDISASINALRAFGVEISNEGDFLKIKGTSGVFEAKDRKIDVKESGTLFRFISGFAGLAGGSTEIYGSRRMQERPINPLLKSLSDLGVNYEQIKEGNAILKINGKLKGGTTQIRGDVSSQFISTLLLVGPYCENDVEIKIESDLVSRNYVDMTIKIMEEFGVIVENKDYKKFIVKSGQKYKARDYFIHGDCSSANYFFAAAAIVPGEVTVYGLDMKSNQESGFIDLLVKMGCKIKRENGNVSVKGAKKLNGIEADMDSMPDSVQTLAVVSLFADGMTKIKNIGNLKYKESDRINDTAEELRKFGADVTVKDNELVIKPAQIKPAAINPHNDHRMAMSFALAGLKIGIKIENPECVRKSFPQYWDKFREMGVEIKYG